MDLKKRKGVIAIIEIMIIMMIGLVFLTTMTYSYKYLSENIWIEAKQEYFNIFTNYIDSSFSIITMQNRNMNYAPSIQKYEIEIPHVPETFFSIKGLDNNQVIIKNGRGITKILNYSTNNKIIGYANSQNKKIILACYAKDTGQNIIEINKDI